MVMIQLAQASRSPATSVAWLLVLLCACGKGSDATPLAVHDTTVSAVTDLPTAAAPTSEPCGPAPVRGRTDAAVAGFPERGRWIRLLHGLDRTRSRALREMRPALLGEVYVRGSPVLRGERDVLSAYRDRGVGLLGARLHTASARVVSRTSRRVVLRVVETLGRTTAVIGRHRVLLPADAPTRRAVRLVRTSAGWRIAAARRLAG